MHLIMELNLAPSALRSNEQRWKTVEYQQGHALQNLREFDKTALRHGATFLNVNH